MAFKPLVAIAAVAADKGSRISNHAASDTLSFVARQSAAATAQRSRLRCLSTTGARSDRDGRHPKRDAACVMKART